MSEPTDQPSDRPPGPIAFGPLPKMSCSPSLEELFQYMEGSSDESRQAFVRSDLCSCPGCVELFDIQSQFRRLVEMRCQSELPTDLKDRVFGAIGELKLGPDQV
jgi:mycothiol system anti-sigma-R factor